MRKKCFVLFHDLEASEAKVSLEMNPGQDLCASDLSWGREWDRGGAGPMHGVVLPKFHRKSFIDHMLGEGAVNCGRSCHPPIRLVNFYTLYTQQKLVKPSPEEGTEQVSDISGTLCHKLLLGLKLELI